MLLAAVLHHVIYFCLLSVLTTKPERINETTPLRVRLYTVYLIFSCTMYNAYLVCSRSVRLSLMDDDTCVEGTVGKIVLFPAEKESGHEAVPRSMLNASSDGSSACDLLFSEDASIAAMPLALAEETDGILSTCYNRIPDGLDLRPGSHLESALPELMEELGEVTDDSAELTAAKLPMAFSKGDHIMMVNVIRIGDDDTRKYCHYQIERRFLLEHTGGETECFTALAVDAAPTFDQRELERWYQSRSSADGS